MSWFDTSGIANIAKSALKEAQRTIDKALDIKDDENVTAAINTPIDTNSEDFFGTWGLTQSGNVQNKPPNEDVVTKSPTKGIKGSTSMWGSFTGSFFEPQGKETFRKQARDSVDSLDDSVDPSDQFSGSKLVVHNEDSDVSYSRYSSCDADEELLVDKGFNEISLELQAPAIDNALPVKRREKPAGTYTNRLSVISSEGDRISSESLEVLSGCTTTPDSEGISASSSILGSNSKANSESVEVLPNSLTSPSSVEVLGSNSCSSRRQSQYTDEFVSPLQSPDDNLCISEKMSPDSVEVIPEDQEENSIAEDTMSYNSLSESTTATTVLETITLQLKQKTLNLVKSENMGESISSDVSLSPDKAFAEIPITRAPSRGGMHLPLQVNLIDTQPQSSKQDLVHLIHTSNVIDIPQDNMSNSENDEGSQSDKTLIASDNFMESSSDTSTTTDSNTNSTYLKNMLAEAISDNEKTGQFMDLTQSMIDSSQKSESSEMLANISITQLDMPPRETSPLSSESRSDLVKIGSDQTSGHTSGDELETTTSSDIEIISSPNGDSSSTHSRHSPAKLSCIKHKDDTNVDVLLEKMTFKKIKGHNRELSEASSISDDREIERLIKRLSEMTEILESREVKLIEVSRKNAELQEVNNELRKQMDVVVNKQVESADLSQVTEEYTQRMSALERKFQQAIREKDTLRKQLDQCKVENATRLSKGEWDHVIEEKEETIKELREEGEKLSKQHLQHSNIIKKLRTKEKEHESSIKHLKESVEDLTSETDRLKRSLAAKEEVERSQIEAVHQLTAKNKKLEHELIQVQGNFDDLTQKHETVKKSLDAAKKELIDKNRASSELMARDKLLQTLENEKKMTESQNEDIINQIEDMRSKIRESDQDYVKKEQSLRLQNSELLRRLEEAESRNEELSQSILEVSKPLVRQLETLQATHNMKLASFEKIEQALLIKLNETQIRLNSASEIEKIAKDECHIIKSKAATLENQINAYFHENEMVKMQLEQQKAEKMIIEQDLKRQIDELQQQIKSGNIAMDNLRKEIDALTYNLSIEKTSNEVEKKRNYLLQEQVRDKPGETLLGRTSSPTTGNISPALSLGRVSLSESLGSSLWPNDEPFETSINRGCTNMYEMQLLQTNLKQRDGEVQQLQWELNRREHERTLLNTEISNLLTRIEELESKCVNYDGMEKDKLELQQQYDTLCQLYGEKVEETEELKLDLEDVKDMYKAQIDDLLLQQGAQI